MLVTLNEVLRDAQKNKYAVGLFNTVNLEMAKGVLGAAEKSRSPVIIGTAEALLPSATLVELAGILIGAAKRASVPVVVHFDHGLTEQLVYQAIDLGFSSVMYDCSTNGYEDNLRAVKRMTEYAHKRDVSIEAELGHVGDAGSGSHEGGGTGIFTDPYEAREYAMETGVDALAVSIGSAHGAYTSKPQLQFVILEEIRKQVQIPLVLHGGSGLSDNDFKTAIEKGIAKVNIFTDINMAAAKAAHDEWRAGLGMTELMPAISMAVESEAIKKMRLFGSCGRA